MVQDQKPVDESSQMVANDNNDDNNNNNNLNDDTMVTPKSPTKKKYQGIPIGKYRLVGWGVDATGRRLIDEICQIAAYTPKVQFSQYIMPFSDLNISCRRKYNIRVVNTNKYRMLKDMRSNKFVKTKSEISALTDFLTWLEGLRGDATDGIILIYHEMHKASPGILLESLRRYQLLERFQQVVKGFVNGFHVAQVKCAKTTKKFSLGMMAKILLNRENEDFHNAVDRAMAAFEIAVHLAQSDCDDIKEKQDRVDNNDGQELMDLICPFVNPISAEEEEISKFKILLERQNTFRPVFGALLRASRSERQHASHLRRLLAENNVNYDKLKAAYESGAREGLDQLLKTEIANAKEADLKELLFILDSFFDPEKSPIQPKQKTYPYNNNNKRSTKPRRKSVSNERTSESSSPNVTSSSDSNKGVDDDDNKATVIKNEAVESPIPPDTDDCTTQKTVEVQ